MRRFEGHNACNSIAHSVNYQVYKCGYDVAVASQSALLRADTIMTFTSCTSKAHDIDDSIASLWQQLNSSFRLQKSYTQCVSVYV
jgi:hypothetical protein